MNQIQQGDLILLRVDQLPAGCKPVAQDKRGIVLAEGEATGHYHGLTVGEELSGKVRLVEAPDRRRFLVNESDVDIPLRHQEHHIPAIPAHSIFQVGGVREKDWFNDMVVPVRD
jgi:hypothetical protein